MKSYFDKMFNRNQLLSNIEIFKWWERGRLLLNVGCFIYMIMHFTVVVVLLKNGWIFALLPIVCLLFVVINIIFSIGLLFEVITKRLFRANIDFDRLAPNIKIWEFGVSAILIIGLSIWDILRQL